MKRLAAFLFAFLFLIGYARAQVTVNSGTTVLVDRSEPVAIQKAAHDLARDMEKVFGAPVKTVHRPADAGATTLWIAWKGPLPRGVERSSGWEVLRLRAVANPSPGSPLHDAVVLTGSDMRGTIYAIYQFSQEFLKVDPLYWWTDHPPARQSQAMVPSSLDEKQGPPTFRYRGWFTNDEDLLTGWRPGLREGTGVSLEVWDRVFEAILRLKGNMVTPGTFLFPYEPQVEAAGERGLVVSQHHVEPLGLNTYRWPSNEPYSYVSHPDLLNAAWKRAVSQYRNAEVIWTVGYRGEHDRPFWSDDKSAPASDEERAKVISSAIESQVGIVKAAGREPVFIMNAWQESSKYAQEGFLHIPEGVTLVWPDNGHGLIQDGDTISKGQGVYYHTAMYDGTSNHFTERIPFERIAHELGRAARADATTYLLINTANVRPVVMTTRAVMELAWHADAWAAEPSSEPRKFLHKWCEEEFGPAAPNLEAYYSSYFQAPARYGEAEDQTMSDNHYQTVSRRLLLGLLGGEDTTTVPLETLRFMPKFANLKELANFLAKITAEADGRWQKARALAEKAQPQVPPERRDFFQAHVLTQVGIHLHSNRMVMYLAQAAADPHSPDQLAKLRAALKESDELEGAMRAAGYGQWRGFYNSGDWLLDVPLTIALMKAYEDKLEGRSIPPHIFEWANDGGFAYSMIKAYQGGQRDQF
jgi:hypothetical protein